MNPYRKDFPILTERGMVYLDSAATTQKPSAVPDRMRNMYFECNANIHRSPHKWGREMTAQYECARRKLVGFFGGDERYTGVFTRGTTESINLTAASFLSSLPETKSEVIVTQSEHHSNFVPWQQWCRKLGKKFIVIRAGDNGMPDMEQFAQALSPRTALVAAAQITNVFGLCQPVKEMCRMAHAYGAFMLVDGAQAAGRCSIGMAENDYDFLAVSGHKMYGPVGIGMLIGKTELLERMLPWQYGGEMIENVTEQDSTFQKPPYRFEAGTPDYIGAVGMAEAASYLESAGLENISEEEKRITERIVAELQKRKGVTIPVLPSPESGIVSFVIDGMHTFDAGLLFDAQNIALRCGMHCAQPLNSRFHLESGTIRVSAGIYTDEEDVEKFAAALDRILERNRKRMCVSKEQE